MSAQGFEYHLPFAPDASVARGSEPKLKPSNMEGIVSAERFELSTNGLKGRCSAVELRARHISGLHSNMGNIHRQRKTLSDRSIY